MNITISKNEMYTVLLDLFRSLQFSPEHAELLATTHTQSTMSGVNSHGINRVPIFTRYVRDGIVNPQAQATKVESFGQIERWDGHLGSGIVNATQCTNRAIQLAKQNGLGLVALRNTNHWMRAGTYGWQAANQGCIGIMFTNTQANMPPWGGAASRIGNNPLVISIPKTGGHVVLDMAMSQFSFGKIHEYHLRGENLPFPGGWDTNNQVSSEPAQILETERAMPTGYWKGSALSMVLDMLATLLSAGNSTNKISKAPIETGISQVFLCIDTESFADQRLIESLLAEIIDYTTNVELIDKQKPVQYPGQRALSALKSSQTSGMQVSQEIWSEVLALSEQG
jgi:3-dehydro-L-gulonate 2-dehydrogenase